MLTAVEFSLDPAGLIHAIPNRAFSDKVSLASFR
jgi:hypothetical protein